MAYGTVNADTLVTSTSGGILGAGNASIMKNRIINGTMIVAQRGTSSTTNTAATNFYPVDRFYCYGDAASKFSGQQNAGSVTPPTGFINYLGITSLSSYSVPSGELYIIDQPIEGLNISDLAWGTASAKTVTLSFWVQSSLTGTFGGTIRNSAHNRCYPYSYTIGSSNTWTQISVTIPGDTTGTWLTTNGVGIEVIFGLGVGSSLSGTANTWAAANYFSATGATSVVGTSGATFYITGVQLEVGSSATGFEYRQYGQELALCQRYYERSYDIGTATATVTNAGANWTYINFASGSANDFSTQITFQASKRSTATMTVYSPDTGASGNIGSAGGDKAATASYIGMHGCTIYGNLSGQTNAQCRAHWTASAEL